MYRHKIDFPDKEALKNGYINSDVPVEGCTKYRYYDSTGKECYLYCNYDPTFKDASCKTIRLWLIPLFIVLLLIVLVVPIGYKPIPFAMLCYVVFVFIRVKGRRYIPYAFKVRNEEDE